MANIPTKKLTRGEIPIIGLGLWRVRDEAEFKVMFDVAVKAGYRHFDTAQAYGNESFLGECLKSSGLKREEVFMATKISVRHFGHKHALESFNDSLKNLQTDYVDLLLLHFPVSILRGKTWQAAEEIYAAGQARDIGVSNYTVRHLQELEAHAKHRPSINQVELHVFLQQPELLDYCRQEKIIVEAYSPLAHGQEMANPLIQLIAAKHQKSYAQIMLKWCLQKDLTILPKSVTPERIRQNIELFDFELAEDDMQKLSQLDKGLRTCWDPTHVP